MNKYSCLSCGYRWKSDKKDIEIDCVRCDGIKQAIKIL